MSTSFKKFKLSKFLNTINGVRTKYIQGAVINVPKNSKCQNDKVRYVTDKVEIEIPLKLKPKENELF